MRMGTSPAGQAKGFQTGSWVVQGPGRGAQPIPGVRPPRGEIWINGAPQGSARPIIDDCKALQDAEDAALAAWNRETNPFAKEALRAAFWDAAARRYRSGCGSTQYVAYGVAYSELSGDPNASLTGLASKNSPYQYVAPNNAAVDITKVGVTGFVKAAGQVAMGDASSAGSAVIGLAMIGGAGYLGYYLGKRAKKKARR